MTTAPGTVRGPYANTALQREKILRGALEYFGRYGYWGSSMREIARHIGMSQATMRHHFATKTDLLTAVLDERDRVTFAEFVLDDAPPRSHLDAIAHVVADNAARPNIVRLFTTMSVEAASDDHPAHEYFASRYRRITAEIALQLNNAISSREIPSTTDPEQAARVVLAVMFGLQVQWLLDPTVDMVALMRNHLLHYFAEPAHVCGEAATPRSRHPASGYH